MKFFFNNKYYFLQIDSITKLEQKFFFQISEGERIFLFVFLFVLLFVFSRVEEQRKRQHKEKKNLVLEVVLREQRGEMFYSFIYLFPVAVVLIQLNQRKQNKYECSFTFIKY